MAPSLEVGLPSSTPVNDRMTAYYSQGLRKKYLIDSTKTVSIPQQTTKAEIKYHPNLEQYLARVETSLKDPGLEKEVPKGWPEHLSGPLVWSTADYQDDEGKYIYVLNEDEKVELDCALKYFKGTYLNKFSYSFFLRLPTHMKGEKTANNDSALGLEGQKINRDNFPMPTLSVVLDQMAKDLYQGKGFATLRGLDVDAYSTEDATLLFLGVSSYIGNKFGKQDLRGSTISKCPIVSLPGL
jgi:hypothetical protein